MARDDVTLAQSVLRQRDIATVKVWREDGILAWTNTVSQSSTGTLVANRDRHLIDHRFPLDDELGEAIHDEPTGRQACRHRGGRVRTRSSATSSASSSSSRSTRRSTNSAGQPDRRIRDLREPAGAQPADRLAPHDALARGRRRVPRALGGARSARARRVADARRQNAKLRARTLRLAESNRLLEESALEAVESLNATVDAKDPYTAGHSQRVQRIAVALGEELGLERERLEVLRFAGLFHDIGKIGVPDAILTKPDRLTERRVRDREAASRRTARGSSGGSAGSSRGAGDPPPPRAVGRDRLPARLRGDGIPLEAAIVGLADAVDAMTTDRPYSCARTLDEATDGDRRGTAARSSRRLVVDAFVALVERKPELFGSIRAARARSCLAR